MLSLSASSVLLLLAAGLILLGLGTVSASSWVQGPLPAQIAQLRKEVETIDARIGSELISPFYLSRVSPCYDFALRMVTKQGGLSLSRSNSCVWVYKDIMTGQIIAEDRWLWEEGPQPALRERVYYSGTVVIARDFFDSQARGCFRQREYYVDEETADTYKECYSEAGRLRSIESANVLSPIPPMAYWFFYR